MWFLCILCESMSFVNIYNKTIILVNINIKESFLHGKNLPWYGSQQSCSTNLSSQMHWIATTMLESSIFVALTLVLLNFQLKKKGVLRRQRKALIHTYEHTTLKLTFNWWIFFCFFCSFSFLFCMYYLLYPCCCWHNLHLLSLSCSLTAESGFYFNEHSGRHLGISINRRNGESKVKRK